MAEWSVAKNGYVQAMSGWFSCRLACYLAAGRPAILQDTGFSGILPVGEGLLAFTTFHEAAHSIRNVHLGHLLRPRISTGISTIALALRGQNACNAPVGRPTPGWLQQAETSQAAADDEPCRCLPMPALEATPLERLWDADPARGTTMLAQAMTLLLRQTTLLALDEELRQARPGNPASLASAPPARG